MTATVELPSMIAGLLGGIKRIEVTGDTCGQALEDAFRQHPTLRNHIFDESGALRQHVLCFLNDVNTRWEEGLSQPLADGDRITILQAVSGG